MKTFVSMVVGLIVIAAVCNAQIIKNNAPKTPAPASGSGIIKNNTGATTAPASGSGIVKNNPTPAPAAAKGKGISGKVCTLMSCLNGKASFPSKDEAISSANRGEILCLMVGKRCCLVLNSDGTNASSKLAAFAGGNVTVTGKMMSRNGMNVILADSMK
ncbi:MAG: hypothetical protein JNL32_11215 [Candidatus Kapabacteria bacterium]|nr:hypothetical protein [Candidatus Kapabacteria bacterium]